jgi:hypothetical protein
MARPLHLVVRRRASMVDPRSSRLRAAPEWKHGHLNTGADYRDAKKATKGPSLERCRGREGVAPCTHEDPCSHAGARNAE